MAADRAASTGEDLVAAALLQLAVALRTLETCSQLSPREAHTSDFNLKSDIQTQARISSKPIAGQARHAWGPPL